MALEDYSRKRSFEKTPEPPPSAPSASPSFSGKYCIQRHHARQLHYDLRLEVGGVLKSWAVPKGPTLDPKERRMAVHVEDHPMEYGGFEGNIPAGNYGAGSVMLWDTGSFELLGDVPAEQQLERGDFKFRLHGSKLLGDFALVRTKTGNQWLLIKKKDAHAASGWDIDQFAYSALTGRTQEEIARDLGPAPKAAARKDGPPAPGSVRAPMPASVVPMAAFAASKPPGKGWLYEVKLDGVRALCFLDGGKLRMMSRRGNAMDRQYPELSVVPHSVRAQTAVLDGEIVSLDEHGVPSFALLQRRITVADANSIAAMARNRPVVLYLFDLLYLDGYDIRGAPIEERKRLLASIVTPSEVVRRSEHFPDIGAQLLEAARERGLEGIVAKRARSCYEPRRSYDWLKIKLLQQQEFVICGYTTGDRDYFSSLVLAVWERDKLKYTGNVGTGFDNQMLQSIFEQLRPLVTTRKAFAEDPQISLPITWVQPELVCEVKFSNWTEEGRLRAPVFLGLRADVDPKECVRETATTAPPPEAAASCPPSDEPEETVEDSAPAAYTPIAQTLLEGAAEKVTISLDGRRLIFTNLNKLYYPRDGYKKRDVLNYYHAVAPLLLPHIRDRALSLRRYPDGIDGESFFQKDASEHFPSWLRLEPIYSNHNEAPIRYLVADDMAALLYLVNLGCIDQNPWMSRIGSLENPDFMLIDLDPHDCGYDKIVEAAQLVRRKLDVLELEGYPKTTGGDGMHIYVPLEPRYSYEQVRSLAEILARVTATERPDLFTTPRAVSRRDKGKVYFDWAQISTGKTISAPYVLRAYQGAPVATPLEWREVKSGLTPQRFHIGNALDRFERAGDLFGGVLTKLQKLEKAVEKLDKLMHGA